MLNTIKTETEKTKQFAKKHKTSLSCIATAVATYTLTREYHIQVSKEFAYDVGCKAGALTALSADCVEFLVSKDLMDEFVKFAPRLRLEV